MGTDRWFDQSVWLSLAINEQACPGQGRQGSMWVRQHANTKSTRCTHKANLTLLVNNMLTIFSNVHARIVIATMRYMSNSLLAPNNRMRNDLCAVFVLFCVLVNFEFRHLSTWSIRQLEDSTVIDMCFNQSGCNSISDKILKHSY